MQYRIVVNESAEGVKGAQGLEGRVHSSIIEIIALHCGKKVIRSSSFANVILY